MSFLQDEEVIMLSEFHAVENIEMNKKLSMEKRAQKKAMEEVDRLGRYWPQ